MLTDERVDALPSRMSLDDMRSLIKLEVEASNAGPIDWAHLLGAEVDGVPGTETNALWADYSRIRDLNKIALEVDGHLYKEQNNETE